ncbi:hypothetical protein PR048_004531 [Dryococelus australis]|uniref:DDE-1 domain-containing protein n=1 Tax=Dryococelus australis TaxID=614101 RepID=A0ABQ9I6G5_9NEOP|nr:hypothetical protein PR048_004531 [Dryococelus australis]
MTSKVMQNWLKMLWNRRPGALLRKRGMLVLNASSRHMTLEVKSTIANINTDLVVKPEGMTSILQVLDVLTILHFLTNDVLWEDERVNLCKNDSKHDKSDSEGTESGTNNEETGDIDRIILTLFSVLKIVPMERDWK